MSRKNGCSSVPIGVQFSIKSISFSNTIVSPSYVFPLFTSFASFVNPSLLSILRVTLFILSFTVVSNCSSATNSFSCAFV